MVYLTTFNNPNKEVQWRPKRNPISHQRPTFTYLESSYALEAEALETCTGVRRAPLILRGVKHAAKFKFGTIP